MAEFSMGPVCTACVSCWVSGVLDVSSRGLWWFVRSLYAQLVLLPVRHFCACAFEKVKHIIYRQGHMLSSHPPLIHPHNAHYHAHSCLLVAVCLPMAITGGQFTFSTHSSMVLCPRCGHIQAPSVDKPSVFSGFFFHEKKVCMCWQANKAALVSTVVCLLLFISTGAVSHRSPCSPSKSHIPHLSTCPQPDFS